MVYNVGHYNIEAYKDMTGIQLHDLMNRNQLQSIYAFLEKRSLNFCKKMSLMIM